MDDKNRRVARSVPKQFLLGLITNFSALAPSMSLGFSAIAIPVLKHEHNPHRFDDDQASWFASIASIATPIGCFLSGPFSDKFGRRKALFLINVVGLAGWITIATGYYVVEQQYSILLVGRILTGLSTGLASMPASVYMAEISSPELRGVFTTWGGVFFSFGVLIVYVIGYILKEQWGTAALIVAGFPILGIALITFFMPESPSWLVTKSRIEEAKRSMCKIFNMKDFNLTIQEEIDSLLLNKQKAKTQFEYDNSFITQIKNQLRNFKKPTCYKPFILMVAFFFFQQFSGTFVIVFYAIQIVQDAGVKMDAYTAIVCIALTRFIAALLVSWLTKKFGRRPNSIVSGAGMTICMAILATYLYLIQKGVVEGHIQQKIAWLPITMLMVYFFASTLGFLTMPFAMTAELFPSNIRGTATGVVTCIGYIFNFITVKIYPFMKLSLGSIGLFAFYGSIALAGTIFIIIFLPETNGKTLAEIEEYFDNRRSENNNNLEQKKPSNKV